NDGPTPPAPVAVAPACSVPLFVPAMSSALPSPDHQPTRPEGAVKQTAAAARLAARPADSTSAASRHRRRAKTILKIFPANFPLFIIVVTFCSCARARSPRFVL